MAASAVGVIRQRKGSGDRDLEGKELLAKLPRSMTTGRELTPGLSEHLT